MQFSVLGTELQIRESAIKCVGYGPCKLHVCIVCCYWRFSNVTCSLPFLFLHFIFFFRHSPLRYYIKRTPPSLFYSLWSRCFSRSKVRGFKPGWSKWIFSGAQVLWEEFKPGVPIIFLGGILVLFIYITRLASDEIFSLITKLIIAITLTIPFLIWIIKSSYTNIQIQETFKLFQSNRSIGANISKIQ